MRTPVVDDLGKVRWAVIPDDCTGQLERPMPISQIIMARAQVVYAVYSATHGAKWPSYLRDQFKITPAIFQRVSASGHGTLGELASVEMAFQNAVARIRLIAPK